jgi:hypothetical protein
MLEAVPVLATTLVFIGIFAYSYASLELEEIKANWNERRCEPLVMVAASSMNVNNIDPAENFEFCIGKIIDASIGIFLAPMLKLFSKQVDATKPITESMNYLRGMAASLMKPLMDIFGQLWNRFGYIVYQAARVFYKLYSAMDRIFGIATAAVFAGMSMFRAIQNTIGFVFQVIIAILIILCILVIFLYFVMWPVIPLILTMIGILSATVYAGNVSGMAGSFCVSPLTLVKTRSGWKMICEIEVGEELDDGVVEGVLKFDGTGGSCVSIDGLIISKSHLIFNGIEWVMAEKHQSAIECASPVFLYCLNTSTRTWTAKGSAHTTEHLLRDWEELPDLPHIDFAWETLIDTLLNGDSKPLRVQPGRGLFGKDTIVWTKAATVDICDVVVGDYIKDKTGFTKVIGVYTDSQLGPLSGPNSSVWYWSPIKKRWIHPRIEDCVPKGHGFHLITESGTFFIGFHGSGMRESKMLVRDFTEVGATRINETYSFTKEALTINLNQS